MVLAAGCGTSGAGQERVDWDLRHGHTAAQVHWHGGSSFELDDGVQVRLRLPDDKVFDERVDRFGADRDGTQVRDVLLYYPASSVPQAHSRADRLGRRWEIDMRNIDAWYERERANPHHGDDIPTASTGGQDSTPIGARGPIPTLETLYSFDDARPVVVKLEFFWKPSAP